MVITTYACLTLEDYENSLEWAFNNADYFYTKYRETHEDKHIQNCIELCEFSITFLKGIQKLNKE